MQSTEELSQKIIHWLSKHHWQDLAARSKIVSSTIEEIKPFLQSKTPVSESQWQKMLLGHISNTLYNECIENKNGVQQKGFKDLGVYLNRVALSQCQDLETANNATNFTLETIWKKRQSLNKPSGFLGYAKITLVRELWRLQRKQEQFPNIESIDEHVDENDDQYEQIADDDSDSPELQAEFNDRLIILLKAIKESKQLASRDKQVIYWLWLEELTYREIAVKLAVTIDALNTLLTRLRGKIKKDYKLWALLEGYAPSKKSKEDKR